MESPRLSPDPELSQEVIRKLLIAFLRVLQDPTPETIVRGHEECHTAFAYLGTVNGTEYTGKDRKIPEICASLDDDHRDLY